MKSKLFRANVTTTVLLIFVVVLALFVFIKNTICEEATPVSSVDVIYHYDANDSIMPVTITKSPEDTEINFGRVWIEDLATVQNSNVNFVAPEGKLFIGWKTNTTTDGAYTAGDHFTQDEFYSLSANESVVNLEAVWGYPVYVDGINGCDDADGLSAELKFKNIAPDGEYVENDELAFNDYYELLSSGEINSSNWEMVGPVRTMGRAYEILAKLDSGNPNANVSGFSVNGDSINGYSLNADDTANLVTNFNGAIIVIGNISYKDEYEGRYEYITYGDLVNSPNFNTGTITFDDGVYNETFTGVNNITGYSDNDPVKFTRSSTKKYTAKSKISASSEHYLLKKVLNNYSYELNGQTFYTYGRITQYTESLRAHIGKALMTPINDGLVLITSNDGNIDYTSNAVFEFGDYTRYASGGDLIYKNMNISLFSPGSSVDKESAVYIAGYSATGNYLSMDEGINIIKDTYHIYFNIYGGGYTYRTNSRNYSGDGGNNLGDAGPATKTLLSTRLTIKSGRYDSAYSGNYQLTTNSDSGTKYENNANVINVYGGTFGSYIGGGHEGANGKNFYQYIYGGTTAYVYGVGGGSSGAMSNGNVYILFKNASTSLLYGGSASGTTSGTINIYVKSGDITSALYGGNSTSVHTGNINVNIAGGTVKNITGGCATNSVNGKIAVNISGGTITGVLYTSGKGGSKSTNQTSMYHTSDYYSAILDINDPRLDLLYYGVPEFDNDAKKYVMQPNIYNAPTYFNNNTYSVNGNTYHYGHIYSVDYSRLFQGISRSTYTANGFTQYYIGYPYYELSLAKVNGTEINISGGTINCDIYGGGQVSVVDGDIALNISGGVINGNVYAGGDGTVEPTLTLYKATNSTTNTSVTFTWKGSDTFNLDDYDPYYNPPIDYENKWAYSPLYDQIGGINGNTYVNISGNARIVGNVYGGGNAGQISGSSTINISGNPTITKSVFGGGNHGNVLGDTNINIVGGTISNNVYGGGNTSKVLGAANVKLGQAAVNNATLTSGDINVGGTIFGGGDANASGSTVYDFSFISVSEGVDIQIDASNHTNFDIHGSIFGSGNASSSAGDSSISIKNYGSADNIKRSISIQRATTVDFDNSFIELEGTIDSTNRWATTNFSLNRIDTFNLKNGSEIYLRSSTNLLERWNSIENNTKATDDTNNKLYIYEGNNAKVSTTEDNTVFGDVSGISKLGIYKIQNNDIIKGIYDFENPNINQIFDAGVYVVGNTPTDETIDGFYSNFYEDDEIKYHKVDILPFESGSVWKIGSDVTVVDITLNASNYIVTGKYAIQDLVQSLAGTNFQIQAIDYSSLATGVNIISPSDIPSAYSRPSDANNNIGLEIRMPNDNGWNSSYSLHLLSDGSYYSGDQLFTTIPSSTVPKIEILLTNANNFTRTTTFGTVSVLFYGIKKISEIESQYYVVRLNITINPGEINNDIVYESQITSGEAYAPFGNASVNINQRSSFSVSYALNHNSNPFTGEVSRILNSDHALPKNTKITLIDLSDSSHPKEYYYHVSDDDVSGGVTSYELNKFIEMGTLNPGLTYNDATNYYRNGVYSERFIVTVDFSSVDEDDIQYSTEHSLLLRTYCGDTYVTVDNALIPNIKYTIIDSIQSYGLSLSSDDTELYRDEDFNINASVTMSYAQYKDTSLNNQKFGVELLIYRQEDSNYRLLSDMELLGKKVIIDNYENILNGHQSFRVKYNDSIINANKTITISQKDLSFEPGNYHIVANLYKSHDGILSSDIIATNNLTFTVLNDSYGLNAQIDSASRAISASDGTDLSNNNQLTFTVNYQSSLLNPNIDFEIFKQSGNNLVPIDPNDFMNNATDYLDENTEKYIVSSSPASANTLIIEPRTNLSTGSYVVRFELYDNDHFIGSYDKQLLVY